MSIILSLHCPKPNPCVKSSSADLKRFFAGNAGGTGMGAPLPLMLSAVDLPVVLLLLPFRLRFLLKL